MLINNMMVTLIFRQSCILKKAQTNNFKMLNKYIISLIHC